MDATNTTSLKSISSIMRRLKDPGPDFRGTPFWAWNARIDPDECRRQIRIFAEMGLGGFFMHSRTGLATEFLGKEWFDCVRACIDEAERFGMHAWMYDEDRYPSGAAGGIVTSRRRFRASHIAFEDVPDSAIASATKRPGTIAWFAETPCDPPHDASAGCPSAIGSYRRLRDPREILRKGERRIRYFRAFAKPDSWFNGQTYLDTLNPEAVREFIHAAYEPYARELGNDFGTKVPGCFTDEPSFGSNRPWTGSFARIFAQRHGYDISDHLPELVKTVGGRRWSHARFDFLDTATELFIGSFARTIGRWCDRHGVLFTGHVFNEDSLGSQSFDVGSAMRFYEYMQAPGIDQLCETWDVYATAKQCASVARQFGHDYRLAECYGVTGWDFALEGHKAIGDWLMALGINHRCQHLAWYSMAGTAKRDYPASIFRQSPWHMRLKAVEDYFARIGETLSAGVEVRPLLVISPLESVWGYLTLGWNDDISAISREQYGDLGILLGEHIDFDYGDEGIMARHGRINGVSNPTLAIGKAEYRAVLVPRIVTIRQTTLRLLYRFAELGGKVFYLSDAPEMMDGRPSEEPGRLFTAFARVSRGNMASELGSAIRQVSVSQDGSECNGVLAHLRKFRDGMALFLVNTSHQMPTDNTLAPKVRDRRLAYPDAIVRLTTPQGKHRVFELDTETGNILPVDAKCRDGVTEFAAPLGRLQSRLFLICSAHIATSTTPQRSACKAHDIEVPQSPMRYKLHESNAIVLDGAVWRVNAETSDRPKMHVLDIDDEIRTGILGVAPRSGRMVQPWCSAGGHSARTARIRLEFRFGWNAPAPAKPLRLALERPDVFKISINGVTVAQPPKDGAWWIDPCLRIAQIPAETIRNGENILVLDCDSYHEGLPGLEPIFLLGEFGVSPDGTTAIPLPDAVMPGDLCGKGFPNYSGNFSYFFHPRVTKSGPCRIRIDDWRGVALGFRLNGGEEVFRPWPPYEAVFDEGLRRDGSDQIEVILYGHRRNAFGPFYLPGGETSPEWCGPQQLRATNAFPVRNLVPFGLGADQGQ